MVSWRCCKGIGQSLQSTSTALLDLGGATGQPGEEAIQVLTYLGGGAKAGIGRLFFANPVPDGFIRIEVRAVCRQRNQAQVQAGGRQVVAHRLPMIRRAVIPDDDEWLPILGAQLFKKATDVSAVQVSVRPIASTVPVSRHTPG